MEHFFSFEYGSKLSNHTLYSFDSRATRFFPSMLSRVSYDMKGTVGGVSPSISVTYFCALAASRRENVCANSASVLTNSMALLNSSIALSKWPLCRDK